jgi:hypothetical protein
VPWQGAHGVGAGILAQTSAEVAGSGGPPPSAPSSKSWRSLVSETTTTVRTARRSQADRHLVELILKTQPLDHLLAERPPAPSVNRLSECFLRDQTSLIRSKRYSVVLKRTVSPNFMPGYLDGGAILPSNCCGTKLTQRPQ